MHINLLGINHHTAPLHIREAAAVSIEQLPKALSELRAFVAHGIILSTCNRTEIYASGKSRDELTEACEAYFNKYLHIDFDSLSPYFYSLSEDSLVKHLFRVTCGLDSMIIGEYEVLGQVKQAVETAEKMGMTNAALKHVFQSAVRTGRRAREETGISKYALSVSSVAVNKAVDIISDVAGAKIVIIGAGEAGKQAAKVARSRGIEKMVIVSRTNNRAIRVTEKCGGTPIGIDKLKNELKDTDIIIACAASPHIILNYSHVEETMRNRLESPLVIIDIAMPRNVDPEVSNITNVHLFNIDDLNYLADKNRAKREQEIDTVEKIISQETDIFMRWWVAYRIRPAIKALMGKAEKIRAAQYNKSIKRLHSLTDEEKGYIERLTTSIVDKILRDPIMYLKSADNHFSNNERTTIIKELFKLDDMNDNE